MPVDESALLRAFGATSPSGALRHARSRRTSSRCAGSLLVLFALLTCAGNRVLAVTVAEPTISGPAAGYSGLGLGRGYFPDKGGAMSVPFRVVYGFSVLQIEVAVPEAKVRHFQWNSCP